MRETFGKFEGRTAFPSSLAGKCFYSEEGRCSKVVFSPESSWNARGSFMDMVRAASGYDVISFDIFDTLILRGVRVPSDLFRIIACEVKMPDFAQMRIEAEQECYRLYGSGTSIHDIYAILALYTGMNPEEGIRRELEYEKKFCYANPFMRDCLIMGMQSVSCLWEQIPRAKWLSWARE